MTQVTQASFAAPLLDRSKPPPSGLRSWTGAEPVRRYGVYRNNVATGLARALAARFPVTEKIVGEDFFTAMARDYVLEHPPSSPVLLHYGNSFADFVAGFAPAASVPYLADIVRLEDAQVRAYHAADIASVDPQVLTRIAPERMAGLTFIFHPAASVLRSAYPVVTIWSMNSGEQPLTPIADWQAEDALVTRPELAVLTRRIAPGSTAFLLALMAGDGLAGAFGKALTVDETFDLGGNLADLLRSGAVIDILSEPPLEA
ncbi:HvfC/BufC N-terminal domain-containing protein [Taklimakanibacter lacteus]|uniref:HvfC/BufC N-terminal domain-containing protein n=1 Tax=Taklimakanibacter lacteus TaxID=2268456 RepID=UPI000E6726D1